ncbi:hypothetical protein PWT90_04990 [Aphanocladium album]|nr:hypothetical protein PWT90_04990 [Aphanocladium album]
MTLKSFLASIAASATLAVAKPGIAELDIIFPRNETYKTDALFPIVFSFRDPNNATSTLNDFGIGWVLTPAADSIHYLSKNYSDAKYLRTGTLYPSKASHGGAEYLWTSVEGITSKATKWMFGYGPTSNCTDGDWGLQYTQSTFLYFTTGDSAPSYSIEPEDCGEVATYMLNITSESGKEAWGGRGPPFCGYSTGPPAKADPCGARIPDEEVKKILEAATSKACLADKPVVTCPAKPSEDAPSAGGVLTANSLLLLAGLLACSLSLEI